MNKNIDSETAFKHRIQRRKGHSHNGVFQSLFHESMWRSYEYIEPNILRQPRHSVPMARRSVCFIADAREDCIAILNSQTTAAGMQNIKIYSNTWTKKLIQRLHLSIESRGGKGIVTMVYFRVYSMNPCCFCKMKHKMRCANSQSTTAVSIWTHIIFFVVWAG